MPVTSLDCVRSATFTDNLLPFSMGCVFCDPKEPIRVCTRFRARILLFNIEVPITQGFPVSASKHTLTQRHATYSFYASVLAIAMERHHRISSFGPSVHTVCTSGCLCHNLALGPWRIWEMYHFQRIQQSNLFNKSNLNVQTKDYQKDGMCVGSVMEGVHAVWVLKSAQKKREPGRNYSHHITGEGICLNNEIPSPSDEFHFAKNYTRYHFIKSFQSLHYVQYVYHESGQMCVNYDFSGAPRHITTRL